MGTSEIFQETTSRTNFAQNTETESQKKPSRMQGAMNNFNFSNINEILSDSVFLEEREYPSNLRPFNVPSSQPKFYQIQGFRTGVASFRRHKGVKEENRGTVAMLYLLRESAGPNNVSFLFQILLQQLLQKVVDRAQVRVSLLQRPSEGRAVDTTEISQ